MITKVLLLPTIGHYSILSHNHNESTYINYMELQYDTNISLYAWFSNTQAQDHMYTVCLAFLIKTGGEKILVRLAGIWQRVNGRTEGAVNAHVDQ